MKKGNYKIKIIVLTVLLAILLPNTTWNHVYAKTKEQIQDIMDLSGILRNSEGNYIADSKYVTRAEFAQMLVQASTYDSEAKDTRKTKLFRDVNLKSSQAAYIQIAVSKGYMSGYLGGKFQPKKAVVMKEVVYATLKLLGYTDEDFSGNTSVTRYDKFKELGLGKNITFEMTDKLKKTDCETLFYNLLNAKQKTGVIYAAVLGFPINEDGSIDDSAMLEKQSKGPFIVQSNWENSLAREVSSYKIYKNNQKFSADNIADYSVFYYADQANKIWVFDTKVYGRLDDIIYNNGKPQSLSVAGTSYTVEHPEDMKKFLKNNRIEKDSMVVLLLGRDDKVSYILPIQSAQAKIGWQQQLGFAADKAAIYKNGIKITPETIQDTDIIYYSRELKTIWVYTKKAYGVIESISPSVSAPKEIVVAGITYPLNYKPVNTTQLLFERSEDITVNIWGERLRENGIQEGDNVVVLFGYNGTVADICPIDNMSVNISGYVLEVENKVIKASNQQSDVNRVIRIVDTEGTIREIPCSDNTITQESVVELKYESGLTIITKVKDYSFHNIVGLSENKIADGARILEVNKQDFTKLTAARLKEVIWNSGHVMYCKQNSAGEITDLILTNLTDSFYQYAFLKELAPPDYEKGIYGFQLTFDINHKEITMVLDDPKWNLNTGPKAIQMEDNKLKEMKDLLPIRILSLSGKQANTKDKVYRVSDDVLVYYYKNGAYYKGSFDDISNQTNCVIEGYLYNAQGPVRIIVVSK